MFLMFSHFSVGLFSTFVVNNLCYASNDIAEQKGTTAQPTVGATYR